MTNPAPFSRVAAVALAAAALLAPPAARAQAASAVLQFDSLVRNYNIVTFDDANLTLINNDAEGPLAIGGDLTVGGVPLVNFDQFETSPDPTLYVAGTFNVTSNFAQLNSGYASLPGNAGTGLWHPSSPSDKRYQTPQGGTLDSANASHPNSFNDPRTNPGPAGWNFSTLRGQFTAISNTLAGAAATGAIGVTGQTLTFSGAASGLTIFNLDANLLGPNSEYNGAQFSGIGLNIGSDAVYVVNLLNAGGKTIFGGNGVNFNTPANAGASRLLWNIVAGTGPETSVALGNGGQFYGSVLAPGIDLANTLNTPINGQIISESLLYTNAEVHYAGFTPPESLTAIPEPSTYALIAGVAVFMGALRRRRQAPGSGFRAPVRPTRPAGWR